jgi:hypothetical protein
MLLAIALATPTNTPAPGAISIMPIAPKPGPRRPIWIVPVGDRIYEINESNGVMSECTDLFACKPAPWAKAPIPLPKAPNSKGF